MIKKILIFGIIAFLTACSEGGILSGDNLGGKAGELLIVINDEYKNSEVSVQLSDMLNQYDIGLTQSEPPFNLLTISRNHFSSVFRPHRNILFVDIDKKYKKSLVQFHKDMWTKNQAYVGVGVSSPDSLIIVLNQYHKSILDYFIQAEVDRYVLAFKHSPNQIIQKEVYKKFDLTMNIPVGYTLNKNEEDFAWISLESNEHSQGLIIYSRPYNSVSQLEKWKLLQYRDSILKKYIPGPSDGSYMTTEYILPIQEKVGRYIENDYTVELRGKWRVEHDFMAGPFTSYSFVNKDKTKLITIESYVYYPNKNKRNYMRELEAICRSTHYVTKASTKENEEN